MKIGLFSLFERFEGSADKAILQQLELIALADELGFDESWIGEHHFNDFSVCPSPSILMTYAIAKTKNIRIGAAGYLAPFYDAVRLAEEVSMLDNLSGGRINLGFAKGAFAPDSKHFKVQPEDMRKAMFEVVEGVTSLLKDVASYKGDYVSFYCADIEPKPIQKEIPTYIATFGSEESIVFAA
ncbi:MAG: LLM class flavin-dependent oxidoreductase, partial [Campylobacterales bacterium]|nr:LLM class flavin-dependent oxidoreductase [Campylobacterales bacterium]